MSKRFQEFLNQSEPKTPSEPEGMEIYAGVSCQVCYAQTDDPVIWNVEKKTLTWTCPEGHPNQIKDFKGF